MENNITKHDTPTDHHEEIDQRRLNMSTRKKGGIKTMPFIIANEAFANVASTGLMPNMVLYLIGSYNLSIATATNLLFYQSAANNFFPLIGAFLSDSFLGRFLSIGLGSILSFLGMFLIWLTAMLPEARPPLCDKTSSSSQINNCKSATPAQYGLLLSAFVLMAVGLGGIKPCSLAFGADQLLIHHVKRPGGRSLTDHSSTNGRVLETFFTWYYASSAISVIIAFTGIVYIQDNAGWKIGFGVPAILMFLACLFFLLASSLYYKPKPTSSIFSSLAQVVVASYRNRKLHHINSDSINNTSSSSAAAAAYYVGNNPRHTHPTNNLRCLNKACIIQQRASDHVNLPAEGVSSRRPWRLCTVDQAEDLKALIRIMPIWSAGIVVSISLSQGSFQVLQARTMDRHITKSFVFPAGSFAMFTIGSAILWLGIYDRIIIPAASKIRGKPVIVNPKIRMGLGLLFSVLAMSNSAIVEHLRRRRAIDDGYMNKPQGIIPMSAMWLVPQHCLVGISEAFFAVASNEFFYSELPKSMSSIAGALGGLAGAFGGLIASSILNTVTKLTKANGKVGWIAADNINQGHFESYYWLLAILSSINLLYFMICSWLYGPCASSGQLGMFDSNEVELGNEIKNHTEKS